MDSPRFQEILIAELRGEPVTEADAAYIARARELWAAVNGALDAGDHEAYIVAFEAWSAHFTESQDLGQGGPNV